MTKLCETFAGKFWAEWKRKFTENVKDYWKVYTKLTAIPKNERGQKGATHHLRSSQT